jgi:hypothetical protein
MSSPDEKPLHTLLTSSLVNIYVGPDSTHWTLHEKLLCHYSPFFASKFYSKNKPSASSKSFGLPDEDDYAFELLVGWLYSRSLRYPEEEKDIGPLLDLYLMSYKLEIQKLSDDIVENVRAFYHNNESYPGLRRVQYIYANTQEDNPMRELMVGSIARYLALSDKIPAHWEKALKRNGQLAVDIIRSIQRWHLEGMSVPDAREASLDQGRENHAVGFSEVEGKDDGSSFEDIKSEEIEEDKKEDKEENKKEDKEENKKEDKDQAKKQLPNGINHH